MKDVLIVGQIPPPHHGQSILTGYLKDHSWSDVSVITLPLRYSASINNVGKFNLRKVFTLFQLILRTWLIAYVHRPKVLYYLPASPNLVPVIRDYLYLKAVRWMFPKTIFHFHAGGLDNYLLHLGGAGRLLKQCYLSPDVSIDVNQFCQHTGEYFLSEENKIVWNGVKVPKMEQTHAENKHTLKVLYLGLLSENKGVMRVLEIARILQERGTAVEFNLVGNFESNYIESEILRFLDTHKLHQVVKLKGAKYDDEKWEEYSQADIFIFPSHHPTETFGIVLAEAMAFGIPIVASDWRSTSKVVSEECALLCDPFDAEEFAEAITRLLGNEDLRMIMGKAGYKRYQEKFTCTEFLNEIEKIFSRVARS